jgi:predicted esterase
MTRVLCLHGCNQDGPMFERLLKDYIKIGAKLDVELIMSEANHVHPNGGKTWFSKPLDVSEIGTLALDVDMVTPTLQDLHVEIESTKADVLLGFSQGGNVVDTYLGMYQGRTRIKKAVIISGYEFVDKARKHLDTPLYSVFSPQDTVVPPRHQPVHYKSLACIEHDKGHKMPTSRPVIRRLMQWIS